MTSYKFIPTPLTKRIKNSLPSGGAELLNAIDEPYYGFNTRYGVVYEGMFYYREDYLMQYYDYILDTKTMKLRKRKEVKDVRRNATRRKNYT